MSYTFKWCLDKTRLTIFDKQVFFVDDDCDKYWYMNGERHRENGPAVEWANGSKFWYSNDKLHRENGPAIEWVDGDKSWYLNGEYYNESDYWEELKK